MTDILSEALNSLRLHSAVYCQSQIAKSNWALEFSVSSTAVFHIVTQGECFLTLAQTGQTIALKTGDMLILPQGGSHHISDKLDAPVCAQIRLDTDVPEDCLLMKWGEDFPATTLVCGIFRCDEPQNNSFFNLLPTVLHFSAADCAGFGLVPTVSALAAEAGLQRPGRQTVINRLADVLLVQIIRAWLADPTHEAVGWLGALRDPQIAAALNSIHAAPAEDWTVARLATSAAMSRSAFAARFHQLVGEPPFNYLTRYRMQCAARLLVNPEFSIIQVAEMVGYESASAFSKIFKREINISPGEYRRQKIR